MLDVATTQVLKGTIYGIFGVLFGGLIFEGGSKYVKTGGSNEFKGKIEALPFFFFTLIFGMIIQHADKVVGSYLESAIETIAPLGRVGVILVMTMLVFNFSVPNFNYLDEKSVVVYAVGILLFFVEYL